MMETLTASIGIITALSVLSTAFYNRQKARLDLQATQIESFKKGKTKMTKIDQLQEKINRTERVLRNALVGLILMGVLLTVGAVYYISENLQESVEFNKRLNIEQTKLLKQLVEKS